MMESLKLEPGDLVEYHIPPGGYGYSDRVGMLGLVVKMGTLSVADLNTSDLCQVLWGRFAEDGPQWYKINHLRRAG